MKVNISKQLIFLFLVYLLVIFSFVISPVTGDIKVFIGGARQADFLDGNFISRVFNSWELKGVANRMTMYILYHLGILFTNFPSIQFEKVILLFYLLFSELLIVVSLWLIYGDIRKKEVHFGFLLISIVMLSTQVMCKMQAEMTTSLILLLGFSVYINATNTHNSKKLFLAGLLIGFVFFYKSILILLSVSFVAAAYIVKKEKFKTISIWNFIILFLGGLFSLCGGLLITYLINPNEIKNIFLASIYQRTLFSVGFSFDCLINFVYMLTRSCTGIPFLYVGLFCFINNIICDVNKKRFDFVFMRLVLWGIPSFIIILANCYFIYHYYIFVLPTIFEFYQCLIKNETKVPINNRVLLIVSLLSVLCVFIFYELHAYYPLLKKSMKILFIGMIFLSIIQRFVKRSLMNYVLYVSTMLFIVFSSLFSWNTVMYNKLDNESYLRNLSLKPIDFSTILYLDDGSGSYNIGNKSYSLYYYPLPLQRISDNSEIAETLFYQELKNQFLTFEGKYVIVQEKWFFNGDNIAIKDKLENEYEYYDTFYRYSVTDDLFNMNTIGEEKIYIRKDL